MFIIKIMKRKDAASVMVAIVLAMILGSVLNQLTVNWAGQLSGLKDGQYGFAFPGSGWKGTYLYPIVAALLQLILLEVFIYIYTAFQDVFKKK